MNKGNEREQTTHPYFCIPVLTSWIAIIICKHSPTGYLQVTEGEEKVFSQVRETMYFSHYFKYRTASLDETGSITISQYSQLRVRSFTAAKRNTSDKACPGLNLSVRLWQTGSIKSNWSKLVNWCCVSKFAIYFNVGHFLLGIC